MAPQSSNPPALPPTVEEAYRRKCIQLKERSKEIENENEAYRLRLTRLNRQIQKTRLERAILLEQIAKRTSTNVEDSEGSPSPPPTPQDKPLRLKRGHRKQLGGDGEMVGGASFIRESIRGLSPGSETYSADAYPERGTRGGSNGVVEKPRKRPSNGFEIYCNDMRPVLQDKHKDDIAKGEYRLEEELARGWKELDEAAKDEFQTRYHQELNKWKEEREAYRRGTKEAAARDRSRGRDSFYGGGGGRSRVTPASRQHVSIMQDEDNDDQDQDHDVDVEMAEVEEQMENDPNDTDPETEVDDHEAGA